MTVLSARTLDALPRAAPASERIYLRPIGMISGAAARAAVDADHARPLAGGPFAFGACEVLLRRAGQLASRIVTLSELDAWADDLPAPHRARVGMVLTRLGEARRGPGGADNGRPLLMGIINATPDSFSDGGAALDPAAAIDQGARLASEGAAILDVGGESTRPGAAPVDAAEELRRVRPVLEGLAALPGASLSIDTRKAAVMRAAVHAGARIINDVSALTGDPDSLAVAVESTATVVLMHMQGDPATMNRAPAYDCAPLDVFDCLEARIAACEAAGIPRARLVADPGIGFGKTGEHNRQILGAVTLLHGLGVPLLVGVSRKGLTEAHEHELSPTQRLPGSLAAALAALDQGVQILRVHDVAATQQAVDVWHAMVHEG